MRLERYIGAFAMAGQRRRVLLDANAKPDRHMAQRINEAAAGDIAKSRVAFGTGAQRDRRRHAVSSQVGCATLRNDVKAQTRLDRLVETLRARRPPQRFSG